MSNMYRWLAIVLLSPLCVYGRQVKSSETHQQTAEQKFIRDAFNKADEFMSAGHYDSAQLWLNKIYARVSYSKPSMFSFFLASRQAEVYYYNNLNTLGLQEALKAENIAHVLKDSLLIADASNFIGLFYMNNNKMNKAIGYYKRGLKYTAQPPYKKQYLDMSQPHHLYGNLAEAFEKVNQPDSAVFYCRLSLQKASEINSDRGIATAHLNLGSAFISKSEVDSARKYFELTREFAVKSKDYDVELTSYSGLANCDLIAGNRIAAFDHLDSGFMLLKKYPHLNDLYTLMFLDVAIKIYRSYDEEVLLIKMLQRKMHIQTTTYERNNIQIQTLLLTGLQNDKRIFNLELAESKSKQDLANTRFYISLLVFLLVIIAFIAYRYYVLQRLKVANLRNKISQDLHDEVGATLSGIAMYSYITKGQIKGQENESVMNSLDIIKDNAAEMVAKLNDIVWAVNPLQDSLYALIQRLRDFSLQLAATKDIEVDLVEHGLIKESKLPMEHRKNIYLICKEAVNNAVKYSACTELRITVEIISRYIHIEIRDNGRGFSLDTVSKGNGLINMHSRAKEIGAELDVSSKINEGTSIVLKSKTTH